MISDEEHEAAKEELGQAITKFYATTAPEDYVLEWILVTGRSNPETEAKNLSIVGILQPTSQRFYVSRGLLLEAQEQWNNSTHNT